MAVEVAATTETKATAAKEAIATTATVTDSGILLRILKIAVVSLDSLNTCIP